MDPFVEEPSAWTAFHHLAISAMVEQLQPQLRDRGYVAAPGDRVWLAEPHRPIYPDVATFHIPRKPPSDSRAAVLVPDEPLRVSRADVEIRESYIDIFDVRGNRLVTGIELISPTNKNTTQGRDLYRRKQQEAHESGINLVEIDLVRDGPHILDIPASLLATLPRWTYLVNLARRGSDKYEFYPVSLREKLPRIRIPLKEGDEDAVLDLQVVFDRAYELGPYPERLDYMAEPMPPLPEEDSRWVHEILKDKGIRT
jgi:hypothetical protein